MKLLCALLAAATTATAQPGALTVLPAASYSTTSGVAPESLAAAFGTNLAAAFAAAPSAALPTQIGNTTVTVTDTRGTARPAPLLAVSPTQVNLLIPSGTALGEATVTVRHGNATASGKVTVRAVAPGIFSANGAGRGLAAATTLSVAPSGARTFGLLARPDPDRGVIAEPVDLNAGDVYLSLYGSGIRGGAGSITATINGETVPVLGAAPHSLYAGLDQVNLGPLPRALANRDEAEIALTIDGTNANRVTVSFLSSPTQGWARRADLLEANSEMSVAELNGRIFILGGYPSSRVSVRTVQVYDPLADSWRITTPLPVALNHTVAASVNGKLYVIGGQPDAGGAGPFVNTTYEFDPVTERWATKSPMPTARGGAAAAVLDGKIYVAGGRPPRGSDFAVYDPATDTWTRLPDLPTQRNHTGAATVGGRIYVTGGRFGAGFESEQTDRVEVFDPVRNAWASQAAMPRPRGGVNVVEAHGCIHVFGGEGNSLSPSGVYPDHDLYNPLTDQWTSLAPMAIPVHGVTGAVFANGLIYLPGGGISLGGASGSKFHQVYRPTMSCRPTR